MLQTFILVARHQVPLRHVMDAIFATQTNAMKTSHYLRMFIVVAMVSAIACSDPVPESSYISKEVLI